MSFAEQDLCHYTSIISWLKERESQGVFVWTV